MDEHRLLYVQLYGHKSAVLESLRHLREGLGDQAPLLVYGGPAFAAGPPVAGDPGYVHLAGNVQTAAQALAGAAGT